MKYQSKSVYHIFAFLLLALSIASRCFAAGIIDSLEYPPLNAFSIPEVDEVKLDNGLRLYLLHDKTLPLFNASVRIHGGAFLESAQKVGLADICGTLLRTGGTEKWSGDELDELLESIGGIAETSIDTVAGRLSVVMLSSYSDLAMEVMAEILRRPRFDKEKIEQEMVSERSMISRRNDQASDIAEREFEKLIYGADSPYARHSEYATLRAITREDFLAFHKNVFKPENVQIAVWGDFDREAVVAQVKKYFDDWPKGEKPLPDFPKVEYEYNSKVACVDLPDATQSNIFLGHIGGRLFDTDNPHRIVMNHIFGLSFGSRLFNEVRSRAGLAYSVYGIFTANMSYPGVFYNYVCTKSETTVTAIKKIIAEIKRMQNEEPTAEELTSSKNRYLNSFVFNFDSLGKILDRMVYFDFFGLPRDFLNKEKEMVEKTTAADVLAVAKKYLHPDAIRVLVVGAEKKFEEPLENLGFGKPIAVDITIAP